ncbi:MAG: hypothetical protein N3I35_13515 [Clostridia bacterium]|nr:hypothetical protein [Clostridia bacterium]
MKKLIALTMGLLLLAGCGASTGGIKTGIGHTVSISKSADATAEKDGNAQVDTVMAAVSFDSNGKILSVSIDNAQTKVAFDTAGKIKSDKSVKGKTKVELGKDYGMIKASKIGKEWFEQIAELEKWMVGKTVDEIKAMKVKEVDENHKNVPDVADLTSKVTVSVEDYIFAVEEAFKNAK